MMNKKNTSCIQVNKSILFYIKIIWIVLFLISPHVALAQVEAEAEKESFPLIESTDLTLRYSEEGVIKAKMITKKLLQYKNGNQIYPQGIFIECYDENKKIVATLRANHAYKYEKSDNWELKGDVEVKGYQDGELKQLNTEELYWDLKEKKIYTQTFVRLETTNELLMGYGFSAMQNLSYYTIDRPEGFVQVDSTEMQN